MSQASRASEDRTELATPISPTTRESGKPGSSATCHKITRGIVVAGTTIQGEKVDALLTEASNLPRSERCAPFVKVLGQRFGQCTPPCAG
jgi:hypothetical protein